MRLLDDRVCVRRDAEVTKIGLIHVPEIARKKPIEGIVTAVGAAKHLANGLTRPLDVKVGDRVMFGKYSGTEIDGQLVMREDDIIGVIDGGGIRLLQDRVVLLQDEADKKIGRLHLPESARRRPRKGIVRFVGPGLRTKKGGFWPMDERIKPGARVIYHVYAGDDIELAGEEFLMMRVTDLHAVEEEGEAA